MNQTGTVTSLYVYYKVQSTDLNDVLAKASLFWQAVRSTGIPLQLETLIKRDQPSSEMQTLMEHYSLLNEDADLAIRQITILAKWHHMPEPRHIEIFTPLAV
jgi:hypothetical protein